MMPIFIDSLYEMRKWFEPLNKDLRLGGRGQVDHHPKKPAKQFYPPHGWKQHESSFGLVLDFVFMVGGVWTSTVRRGKERHTVRRKVHRI
jgi:hypothetical protein